MNGKLICCALLLAAMPVAADEVGHWYLTPQVGGLWSDDDRNIEDEDWLYASPWADTFRIAGHWS